MRVSIKIGNDTISTVPLVWNLGIHFDKEPKWIVHIKCPTSNLYHILRKVAHVQHLLNDKATKTIIQALVLSKIDYCKSIYQGAPTYAINKLQRTAKIWVAEIIKKIGKYDHITPHLMELHWLRIKECIVYKVLCPNVQVHQWSCSTVSVGNYHPGSWVQSKIYHLEPSSNC